MEDGQMISSYCKKITTVKKLQAQLLKVTSRAQERVAKTAMTVRSTTGSRFTLKHLTFSFSFCPCVSK